MDVAAALADRRRYERQLERMHQRHLFGGGLYELRQDGVPLAALVRNRARVARLLARDVAAGQYRLAPGELRPIRVRGKRREVFRCGLVDLVVHGVVAEIVREATAARLSPRVYSYRPGTSWLHPVTEFAGWVRARHRGAPDPRQRGVHVLRLDVTAYTDSIPIGADAPLWPMLRAHLGAELPPLVVDVIRAAMVVPGGGVAVRVAGLPMGQPIAPVLANLYLSELDDALAVPGGCSARYGDDVLVAHPDPAVVHGLERTATAVLDRLRLRANPDKRRLLHLNPAGRPTGGPYPAVGAPSVGFLGSRVAADGTVGLEHTKARALLRDVRRRATAAAATLRHGTGGRVPTEAVGRAVCVAVNRALTPRTAVGELPAAALLRTVVTDRAQLDRLDHEIALIVAGAVTGRPGPRAFRVLPYRTLRTDLGLLSLVAARNAVGQAA